MELGLAGKTVIVTGGGSNIGRGIAVAFGEERANVTIADINEGDAQKVADQIKSGGGQAKAVKTDVTSYESVQAMVKAVLDEFGQVDVLVNNVGWDDFTPFLNITPDRFDRYLNINLRSVINCMHAVLPSMTERKSGRIVSIGSDAGRIGEFRESIYSACKAGVIGLSKVVAKEMGRYGITVNVVCPGVTLSEETVGENSMFRQDWFKDFPLSTPEGREKLAKTSYPLRRLGKPEDIANAVLFLASDAAGWITGQTLSVSGGYSMI